MVFRYRFEERFRTPCRSWLRVLQYLAWPIIALSVLTAGASIFYTMSHLKIEMSRKIGEKTLEILKAAKKPMTTPEISSIVASELGPHRNLTTRSHGTVRLNLVKCWKEGRVVATKKNGEVYWEIKKQ